MYKKLREYGIPSTVTNRCVKQQCDKLFDRCQAEVSTGSFHSTRISLCQHAAQWAKMKTDQRREVVKRFDKATLNTKRPPSRSQQPLDVLEVCKVIAKSYV